MRKSRGKERVWLNPPYGGKAGVFVEKLIAEYAAKRVSAAIVLVNANSTDCKWFQTLWDGLLCFTDHRVVFYGDEVGRTRPTHGSIFAYFGNAPTRFTKAFSRFGPIVKKICDATSNE